MLLWIFQPLGQTIKPVENARHEAYQMRMQNQNYSTCSIMQSEHASVGANTTAFESMLRPEVYIYVFYFPLFTLVILYRIY